MMRISNNAMFDQMRRHLMQNTERLMRAQEQMATQKRFSRLSDNPIDAGRVLNLKGAVSRTDQYLRNIEQAVTAAGVQDQAAGQIHELLARANELLVREANQATSTPATREATRIEMANLAGQLLHVANTRFDGKYVFGGHQTGQPAFAGATAQVDGDPVQDGTLAAAARVVDASALTYRPYEIRFTAADRFDVIDVQGGQTILADQAYVSGEPINFAGLEATLADGTGAPAAGMTLQIETTPAGEYLGDGRIQEVEVQPGGRTPVNMPGDRLFQGAGLADGIDLFALMRDINQALADGDYDAIQEQLGSLERAHEQVSSQRSTVGARVNQLEQVKERQADIKLSLQVLSSNIEDIDVAEAITELGRQQNIYEATLGAAGRIIQPSLLDFLR